MKNSLGEFRAFLLRLFDDSLRRPLTIADEYEGRELVQRLHTDGTTREEVIAAANHAADIWLIGKTEEQVKTGELALAALGRIFGRGGTYVMMRLICYLAGHISNREHPAQSGVTAHVCLRCGQLYRVDISRRGY